MSVLSEQWTLPPGRGGNRVVTLFALVNQDGHQIAGLHRSLSNTKGLSVGIPGGRRHGVARVTRHQDNGLIECDGLDRSHSHHDERAGHSAEWFHVKPPLSPDYRIIGTHIGYAQLHSRQPALSAAGDRP
jgi:hypothetical protein